MQHRRQACVYVHRPRCRDCRCGCCSSSSADLAPQEARKLCGSQLHGRGPSDSGGSVTPARGILDARWSSAGKGRRGRQEKVRGWEEGQGGAFYPSGERLRALHPWISLWEMASSLLLSCPRASSSPTRPDEIGSGTGCLREYDAYLGIRFSETNSH